MLCGDRGDLFGDCSGQPRDWAFYLARVNASTLILLETRITQNSTLLFHTSINIALAPDWMTQIRGEMWM